MVPPMSICAARMGATSSRDPLTDPASTSECPPSHFVHDSMTRSAPSSSGRQRYGEANVLSTTTVRPWRCPRAASAARSATTSVGLEIVSRYITRVRGVMAASTAGRSVGSTKVAVTPKRARTVVMSARVLP